MGTANCSSPARQQPVKLLPGGLGIVFKATFKSHYGKLCKIWCTGSPINSYNGNSRLMLEKVSRSCVHQYKDFSTHKTPGSCSPRPHKNLGCCFLQKGLHHPHSANIDMMMTDHSFSLLLCCVRPSEQGEMVSQLKAQQEARPAEQAACATCATWILQGHTPAAGTAPFHVPVMSYS